MQVKSIALLSIGLIAGAYNLTGFATTEHSGAQINLYGGWSNVSSHSDNQIVIDQYETDTLTTQGTQNTSFIPGAGVSYLWAISPDKWGLIQGVGLGVDFFNDNTKRNGQVYLYGLPEFNNYSYTTKLNSARLLLNGELDFHSIWRFVPFVEGGVGGAYNWMKYTEKANPGITGGGELDLPGNEMTNFAYDVGGGFKMPISQQFEVSFRYLYSDPGQAESSTWTDNGVQIAKPIKVDLSSNSWLFGLSYLIQ